MTAFLQNSHDDGSAAALRVFLLFLCMWEATYRAARYLIRSCLGRYPTRILHRSLSNLGDSNGAGQSTLLRRGSILTRSPLEDAKQTLLNRGPSYLVSFLHSVYVTYRGVTHLYHLWGVSSLDKLLIPAKESSNAFCRWAGLRVARTNTLFLSYLMYDLFHVLAQYPRLGGVDTILHHVIFAVLSVINGTYGLMMFPFGWLIVGEMSTVFLNIRWFLLKSGRSTSSTLDRTNKLFAATFFLTRIGIYSAGIVHMFVQSLPELKSLPVESGVPTSLMGLTCGFIVLGWALNVLWGYKILGMVLGKKHKKGGKKEQ